MSEKKTNSAAEAIEGLDATPPLRQRTDKDQDEP
ncbi:hypothetical protein NB712_002554 [Xanthomonas sacchari]|nr:hypothetical protein [Xanthomonas sacchari]